MNAWLKPYRRAFNLEEPVVNVTEDIQFKQAIDLIVSIVCLYVVSHSVFLMKKQFKNLRSKCHFSRYSYKC